MFEGSDAEDEAGDENIWFDLVYWKQNLLRHFITFPSTFNSKNVTLELPV